LEIFKIRKSGPNKKLKIAVLDGKRVYCSLTNKICGKAVKLIKKRISW
jgi:hypothetical protein